VDLVVDNEPSSLTFYFHLLFQTSYNFAANRGFAATTSGSSRDIISLELTRSILDLLGCAIQVKQWSNLANSIIVIVKK
jgi:hypothetical protein